MVIFARGREIWPSFAMRTNWLCKKHGTPAQGTIIFCLLIAQGTDIQDAVCLTIDKEHEKQTPVIAIR